MNYSNRQALVTGGLGFIGSNLALRLAELGARVTVVDACLPGCGANDFNLAPAPEITVLRHDVGTPEQFRDAIEKAEIIFNLAGDVSHLESMRQPERDLERNTRSQLRFLDACRLWNRGVRVVYASTRQVYGVPEYLPVDEAHPVNPVDFNGVHKYAAGQYHLMLSRNGDMDAVTLRLTNVYGPRISLRAGNQGFLGVFIRRLIEGQELRVFGDGSQLRDPLYAADAVDAFLAAGAMDTQFARAFNIGGLQPITLLEIARSAARAAKAQEPVCVPFPHDLRAIDIGSFYADWRLFSKQTGWTPRVALEEGIHQTLQYFRQHQRHYLP
jgi:nucleoside-diphosphate-sugar epimerase